LTGFHVDVIRVANELVGNCRLIVHKSTAPSRFWNVDNDECG
jgi:hypothetical protein